MRYSFGSTEKQGDNYWRGNREDLFNKAYIPSSLPLEIDYSTTYAMWLACKKRIQLPTASPQKVERQETLAERPGKLKTMKIISG